MLNLSIPAKLGLSLIFLFIFTACISQREIKVNNTIAIDKDDNQDLIRIKAAHVVPTQNQFQALKDEFIAFIHFGPNTFTRKEWGNGMEDPAIFNLENLDTDQWCEAMKAAGMKKVIITVKHHDGFCLWQTRYTEHGIMSTPFENGKGDILKELSKSCEKYGLLLGVYLSPADLYQIENPEGLYGNLSKYTKRTIPRTIEGRPFTNKATFDFEVDDYNEYVLNQLFELLTEYGPAHEVWFDGAHPKRKGGQTYKYSAWKELIETLAPKAVIFGRQDIRWCGNESGGTRDTEWNTIPYKEDPNEMNRFDDITGEDIASLEKLQGANYLHYQQAETNTSIREGWFYRDDTDQKVRSADDVFDIYERSVGGNSTFLLNIPPNREGKFSPRDVATLEETGRRIKATYGNDLLANAKGAKQILDNDETSFVLLEGEQASIEISMENVITINRFVIQEEISNHGERISEHKLEAWIDGQWQELARASNVGYKRILRFPEVTIAKLRLTVLKSRFTPAISKVSAHYYETRPPMLKIERNKDGMVSIEAKQHTFNWKPHGENAAENINSGFKIYYTINGDTPTNESMVYEGPFSQSSGLIKAMAMAKGEKGTLVEKTLGIIKKEWKVIGADSHDGGNSPEKAMDADRSTFWKSANTGADHYLELDLGEENTISGFSYTPQTLNSDGMIENGLIQKSDDGKTWNTIEEFTFGNLINDPTTRTHKFKHNAKTRYIRIKSVLIAGGKSNAAISEIDFYTVE